MKANEQMHIIVVKHAGASLVSLMITSSQGCFLLVLSVFVIPSYSPFSLAAVSICAVLFISLWRVSSLAEGRVSGACSAL